MTLAEALRGPLGLTGTKIACNRGACSACTVWLDGAPVCACMILAIDVGARSVTTIEGLASGETLHPVQAAFIEHDALQCGFCTPGHGDELRRAAGAHARSHAPTTFRRRSADIFAAAAPIRTSSPRRWPRPRRERRDHGGRRHDAQRDIPVRHRQRRPRRGGAAGPVDEPPPLPPNAELTVIGKPVPRQNGRAKVTGATRFTVDVALPGMLHGRILRSPLPHARIRAIDVAAAARHPGVRAVMLVARSGGSARRGRALHRRAGGRGRRRLDGSRGRSAAPHSRRLRAAAVRRGHGYGARAGAPAGL